MRESDVNQSLNAPRLSYGISSKAVGIVWGPTALAIVMVLSTFGKDGILGALVIGASACLLHSILGWAYRKDPLIFDMYGKYSILSDTYHPHAREVLPDGFQRPDKVGRGVRI